MAQNDIRLKMLYGFFCFPKKGFFKLHQHLRCHITIACTFIRHFITHPKDRKRQLFGFIVYRITFHIGKLRQFILFRNTIKNGLLFSHLLKILQEFR